MCLDLVAGVCVFVHAFIYVYMSVSWQIIWNMHKPVHMSITLAPMEMRIRPMAEQTDTFLFLWFIYFLNGN